MSMNKLIETCKAEIEFCSPTTENYSKLLAKVERANELELAFANAIKSLLEWVRTNERSYISIANAEPFVRDLPEFWQEPARVMASLGYYGSADQWMKQNVEDGR